MAGFQRQSLRGLTAQLLFVTILPLTAVIGVISFGSIYLHNHAMRELVAERDGRTAQVAAHLIGNLVEQQAPATADLARLRLDAAIANVFPSDGDVSFVVFDARGRAVFAAGNARMPGELSGHAGVAQALRGDQGITYSADEPGGPEHVIAFAPILVNGRPGEFGLIVEEPWEHAVDPLMRYSLAVPLTTFPVLVLAALAVVFGVRRIVQPLQKLGDQAVRLGAGDFDAVAERVGGIEEVNQLQAALATMAGRIQADQEQLRGYASAVTAAQEIERARLARELHDDTLQNLIFLSQRAQTLRITSERDNPLLAAKIETLRQMALQMVENLRRFSRALRPLYLEDAGLVAALERLADETTAAAPPEVSTAIRVSFTCDTDVPRLAAETELALFRIAQ
ncbi:MAG: histidine kinase, partial [Thermoflexales bacterium]